MNNVIVGFDFSSGSAKAVDLAIDIANRWHNDIRLVYVKKSADEDETNIREEIERRNAGVAHLLKNIKLEYVIRTGKVHKELVAQASEDNASIIIVGTHGMSGFQTNWIGKNTYRTITESEVPVLSVREDFNFNKALENIIVPIDSTAATRQKVPVAGKFAQTFGSTIHILGIYTSDSSEIKRVVNNYVDQIDKYLNKGSIKHTVRTIQAKRAVTEHTLEVAEELDADLICIMTEQEKALSDWFIGTSAQQMLTLSKRPVLTIRPEQIGKDTRTW